MSLFDKLSRLLAPAGAAPDPLRRHRAMAVLLAETARADFDDHAAERSAMRDALVAVLGLDAVEADRLVGQAFGQAHEAVSLHGFLQDLNRELDAAARSELVEWLWRVAYADGQLDPLEEARVRQLADLLYVPHAEFVRLRLKVEAECAHAR